MIFKRRKKSHEYSDFVSGLITRSSCTFRWEGRNFCLDAVDVDYLRYKLCSNWSKKNSLSSKSSQNQFLSAILIFVLILRNCSTFVKVPSQFNTPVNSTHKLNTKGPVLSNPQNPSVQQKKNRQFNTKRSFQHPSVQHISSTQKSYSFSAPKFRDELTVSVLN